MHKHKVMLSQPNDPVRLSKTFYPYVDSTRVLTLFPENANDKADKIHTPYTKTGTVDRRFINILGIKSNGTTGYYDRTISYAAQPLWMMAHFVPSVINGNSKPVYAMGSSAASAGAYVTISSGNNTDNKISATLRGANSGAAITKTAIAGTANRPVTVVAVFPSNLKADAYIYVNGEKYTTDLTGSADTTFTATFVHESIGAIVRGASPVIGSEIVGMVARGTKLMPEAMFKALSINPWQLYEQNDISPHFFANAAAGGSALTGAASTLSAGTVTTSAEISLTGAASTLSASTVTASAEISLTGAASTFSAGTVTASAEISLTGAASTFSAGTVTASTDSGISAALTGAAATFSTGAVTPLVGIAITGIAAAGSTGDIQPASNPTLIGVSLASAEGLLTVDSAAFLLGAAAAGQTGTVTATTGTFVQLSGSAVTTNTGVLTPISSSVVALVGLEEILSPGSLGVNIAKALTGAILSSFSDAILAATSTALSGALLTSAQGTITITSSDVTVPLTGSALSAVQGIITSAIANSLSGSFSALDLGALQAALAPALEGTAITGLTGSTLTAISVLVNGTPVTLYAGVVSLLAGKESVQWVIVESRGHKILAESRSDTVICEDA